MWRECAVWVVASEDGVATVVLRWEMLCVSESSTLLHSLPVSQQRWIRARWCDPGALPPMMFRLAAGVQGWRIYVRVAFDSFGA